jgi:hypothetical protein
MLAHWYTLLLRGISSVPPRRLRIRLDSPISTSIALDSAIATSIALDSPITVRVELASHIDLEEPVA